MIPNKKSKEFKTSKCCRIALRMSCPKPFMVIKYRTGVMDSEMNAARKEGRIVDRGVSIHQGDHTI
jgi:hypothetical protein